MQLVRAATDNIVLQPDPFHGLTVPGAFLNHPLTPHSVRVVEWSSDQCTLCCILGQMRRTGWMQ